MAAGDVRMSELKQSHSVLQAGLELTMLLPLLPWYWDYRPKLLHYTPERESKDPGPPTLY